MSATSSAVKRKYNAKTYKRWVVDLRNETFDEIEAIREKMNLSRSEFLKYLVGKHLSEKDIQKEKAPL